MLQQRASVGPAASMLVLAALATLAAGSAFGQEAEAPYTVPRTADGHPDLQGFWTNQTYTPLERPDRSQSPFAPAPGHHAFSAEFDIAQNTIAIGTALTVEGHRAKDGTEKAVGRSFVLANGERLFLGGSANRIGDGRGPR